MSLHDSGSSQPQEPRLAITDWALRRPVTLCMLCLSLLLFGLITSRWLPLELLPGIDAPQIYVEVPYENATPAEVERLITRPLEEGLSTVTGLKTIRSFSRENSGGVGLEFEWTDNMGAKSIEVRERVDNIRHLLPQDVERVLVFQFNTADMPIFQLRISSERDLAMAYDLLERSIKRPLERVPGVSKVELYGVDKRQVMIRLQAAKLQSLKLDPVVLLRQLQAQNFALSAGEIRTTTETMLVKPLGEFETLDQIKAVPIGRGLTLGDVAQIQLELPKAQEGRHLHQRHAVGMNIYKESKANLVEVSRQALQVIENVRQDPQFQGISLYVMDDSAEAVTKSLSGLLSSGLTGAFLSFAVLYLFLRNVKITLLVVLSVPLAIAITLGAMYALGYSLNILSMMGLMLAIGMLVDNAVVVTESIFRERNQDTDIITATQRGVYRVGMAIIAGTATTVIVFLPNIIGAKIDVTVFLEHVAIAITIALVVSLLLAVTLVPLLSTKIKQLGHVAEDSDQGLLERHYQNILQWMLAHGKASTVIALLLIASAMIPLNFMPAGGEDGNSQSRLFLNYNLDSNYSLREVETEVKAMEAYLYAQQQRFGIESVYSYYTPGYAMSTIMFQKELPMPMAEIKEQLRQGFPALVRSKPDFGWNDRGGGLKLNLLGPSTSTLMQLSNEIVPILQKIPNLRDVRTEAQQGQFEQQIKLDAVALQQFNLNAQGVANAVSLALRGTNLRTFRSAEQGEVQLRVLFDESLSHSPAALQQLVVGTYQGNDVVLSQVARISTEPRLGEIRRYNRQTAVEIGMNTAEKADIGEVRQQIERVLSQLQLPPGYRWSFEGSFDYQDQSREVMMVNMLMAVAMIYLVMAALFESLVLPTAVIGSLLFSMVGVFWAFLITNTGMGVMGMIGMLVLMGIVVNNGIVLVDRINQLQQEKPELSMDARLLEACVVRLRPILMTVATTVLGLLPLCFAGDSGGEIDYGPMAIAIIGGLVFSTLTSLLWVPLTYRGLLAWAQQWRAFRQREKQRVQHWLWRSKTAK